MFDNSQCTLAHHLHALGAFQDKRSSPDGRGFRLKLHETRPDAPLSPVYLNLRTPGNSKPGPLTPTVIDLIAALFGEICDRPPVLHFTKVAGVPRTGDPIAQAFANSYYPHPGLITLRKEEGPGERRVAGIWNASFYAGDATLLVDDVATDAGSKLEAVKVLRDAGLVVKYALVVVDREQGAAAALKEAGVALHAICTLGELVAHYEATGKLGPEIVTEITDYLAANRSDRGCDRASAPGPP